MLHRSVTLIRKFVCTRPKLSIKGSDISAESVPFNHPLNRWNRRNLGVILDTFILGIRLPCFTCLSSQFTENDGRILIQAPGCTHSVVPSAQFSFFQIGTLTFN